MNYDQPSITSRSPDNCPNEAMLTLRSSTEATSIPLDKVKYGADVRIPVSHDSLVPECFMGFGACLG